MTKQAHGSHKAGPSPASLPAPLSHPIPPSPSLFLASQAEKLLVFTARSLALAGWADLEALNVFYEAMLEEFWNNPPEGFVNPSVEDLRNCETVS